MNTIILNEARVGAFTSSEIWKLMTNNKAKTGMGEKGLTYIEEKKIEKRLGRSLETEAHSRVMAWGTFLESRVFDLLGLEYKITSKETFTHPFIEGWAGSRDLLVEGQKIGEIKCYQLKKFCQYTDAILSKDVTRIREDFPAEYWQMVSNSIISQVPNAEAITYCPYRDELKEIREAAENYPFADQWKYRFIAEAQDHELPFLIEGNHYKNLNVFEFEVPEEDKEALTARVKLALTLLKEQV